MDWSKFRRRLPSDERLSFRFSHWLRGPNNSDRHQRVFPKIAGIQFVNPEKSRLAKYKKKGAALDTPFFWRTIGETPSPQS